MKCKNCGHTIKFFGKWYHIGIRKYKSVSCSMCKLYKEKVCMNPQPQEAE